MVAVYDATGVLIGMVAQDAITALAAPKDPNAPKATTPVMPAPKPAPIVQPDANDGPVAQEAQEVTKALAGARFSGGPQSFTKGAGESVDARYEALVRSLDRGRQAHLSDCVARSAMRFQYSEGRTGAASVRLAKSIALDLAAAEARKPKPSIESAVAEIAAAHRRLR